MNTKPWAANSPRPTAAAPAAGWISAVDCVKGRGIFGDVSWTERGRQQVFDRAYHYFSPVVNVRESDRVVIGLHSVALTNRPAIVGMPPILQSEAAEELTQVPASAASATTPPMAIDTPCGGTEMYGKPSPEFRSPCLGAIDTATTKAAASAHQAGLTEDEARSLAISSSPHAARIPVIGASGNPPDRRALIDQHRRYWDAHRSDLSRICESERSFVNGALLAAHQAGLNDQEASQYALAG